MIRQLYALFILFFLSWQSFAAPSQGLTAPPQPTTCVVGTFTTSGGPYWNNVSLTLKNNCNQVVDVQNAYFTFVNATAINTSFWGAFGKVSYPDNNLQITSQPTNNGKFLASLSIHIPETDWANSKLGPNESIILYYGAEQAGYDPNSLKAYLPNNSPVQTSSIQLTNQTAKPANVTQNYAVVNIKNNGQTVKTVQLTWLGSQTTDLNPGTYTIQPDNLSGTNGKTYQGTATPATIVLAAGQKASSVIQYSALVQLGKINLQVSALPNVLAGYTNKPTVTLTRTTNGSTTTKTVNWNTAVVIDQLANQAAYRFATPDITFNNYRCTATFTPAEAVSDAQTPPTVNLSYACVQLNQVNINLNVSGLNNTTSSVNVTFTPNDSATPVTKQVNLSNGSGNTTVQLTDNFLYNVSATSVSGFNASFSPQPLLAKSNAVETVTYQAVIPSTGGRTIGYIPGWKQPPSAAELANAGYTHALIAFGVFSTTQPGKITPAFDTVTKAYIDSLHSAGIKVILSLGGALTSLPNTSVDFHQVLQLSGNPTTFQQTFVQSVKDLSTQYGFDGIDIDIEHGINGTGTFQAPTGDIAVLANIINQLHADWPNFMITMAPQTANISATSGFDGTWANYASLIMQTHDALTWVGIQLYNTGCMYGIDHVCYDPNQTNTPNFSVAMATDVLADWPQVDATGRPTGFKPYISYLRADQVVLGYPSPNAQGSSDGAPTLGAAIIKRAIQCLKTAQAGSNSCGSYVPPKAYGLVGGVFNWEVTYDQNNQFKFARDLKSCVTTGNCG
jgi:chitinase